ncbi:hypothetical protein OG689_43610 [Kitasatospora sp. NBC_00240]|uniref:hypothetical protein n=1 Tax=Kitasatospora sp. NBC_00240 TaxID=2903567 RepID=UPI00225434AC|nr:hypothetical protein [Kitasatospora sp. NBC_00240]MCX5216024.1 hypothetical protein [Kitasatospora sp. NBC_00240]
MRWHHRLVGLVPAVTLGSNSSQVPAWHLDLERKQLTRLGWELTDYANCMHR